MSDGTCMNDVSVKQMEKMKCHRRNMHAEQTRKPMSNAMDGSTAPTVQWVRAHACDAKADEI